MGVREEVDFAPVEVALLADRPVMTVELWASVVGLPVGVIASQVGVLDAADNYIGSTEESILAELPARFAWYGRPAAGQYFRSTGNQTAVAATASRLCYLPVEFGAPLTIDRLGVSITTAGAGSTVRLGIYASAANGYPGALLLDAGTIDSSTTGLKEITMSLAVRAGRYWLAAAAQGGTPPSTRIVTNSKMSAMSGFVTTFTGGAGPTTPTLLVGTNPTQIFEDGVAGALPAAATPVSTARS